MAGHASPVPLQARRRGNTSLLLPMPLPRLERWFWRGVSTPCQIRMIQWGTPAPGAANVFFVGVSGFVAVAANPALQCFLMIHTTTITTTRLSPLTLGKYRIAACPRPLPGGLFAAQVSIASGSGSASTARLMRYDSAFSTHDAAADYAIAQGIDWVHDTARQSVRPN